MINNVETKKTRHKCLCGECRKRIEKGDVRVYLPFKWYHAQCFVDIVESIPDIEELWKNSILKSVTERLKNETL
jgi:hypothetical protein